jgi:hypothetical protein
MIGIQLVAIIFSLFMIYFATIHYRKGEINGMEMLLWTIVWIGALLIVTFPDIVRVFSRTFLISRIFDLMTMGGFILVISMTVKNYLTNRKIERKIEKMVRKDAIEDAKTSKR